MYAETEAVVQRALWHCAGTPSPIARAIFSGTRTAQGFSFIRRICEAVENSSALVELSYLWAQMSALTAMRDGIQHYGARSVVEGQGVVTNALRAHTSDRVTTFPISPTILDEMTADLRKIIFHLLARHVGRPLPGERHEEVDAVLRAPWQYKPVQVPLPEAHKPEGPDGPRRTTPQGPPSPSPQ
jgi:hypothetical protein